MILFPFHDRSRLKQNVVQDVAIRLFCFHPAGGSAGSFRNWQRYVHPAIELFNAELPGRASRFNEAFVHSFEPLVEELYSAISKLNDKPFAIFGHSMGGLLAYEVVHKLKKNNQIYPKQLIISSCRPPRDVGLHQGRFTSKMNDDELKAAMIELGGTPSAIIENDEMFQMIAETMRSDIQLIENYKTQNDDLLHCQMSLFGGDADQWVPEHLLRKWQQRCTVPENAVLTLFQGGHFYFEQQAKEVAKRINALLFLENKNEL